MKDPVEIAIENQMKTLANLDADVKERTKVLEKINDDFTALLRKPVAESAVARSALYDSAALRLQEAAAMVLDGATKVAESNAKLLLDLRQTRMALRTETLAIISDLKIIEAELPKLRVVTQVLNSMLDVETKLNDLDKIGALKFLKGALRE